MTRPRLGIALGGGGARGWAHIGVLRGLEELGLKPDVIAGASIGALVGGAAACAQLDKLERWVQSLSRTDVLMLLDATFRSGMIRGNRVMAAIEDLISDCAIEDLDVAYAAVATDMSSGREVWLRDGSLLRAMRASCALPGLFAPSRYRDRWLIDGGLVNPVPVSLCYAMGADLVIAVNFMPQSYQPVAARRVGDAGESTGESTALERLRGLLGAWLPTADEPGMIDVMTATINIMQERIKRSRLAGEPPDLEIRPTVNIGIMDFHRAGEAIPAGQSAVTAVRQALTALRAELG
jgi:NTE family protein